MWNLGFIMADIFYSFHAKDEDIGTPLTCLVTLSYSPSRREYQPFYSSDSLAATFVLGQFKADDIATQAYDWFVGQHNVCIDKDSLASFLRCIQTCTVTKYIDVRLDIVSSSFVRDQELS